MRTKVPLKRKVATSVRVEGSVTTIRYHNTDIVQFDGDLIHLDTGGWFSVTTKRRMNQASLAYNLNFRVYQHNHKWFVARHRPGSPHEGINHPFNGETFTMSRHAAKVA